MWIPAIIGTVIGALFVGLFACLSALGASRQREARLQHMIDSLLGITNSAQGVGYVSPKGKSDPHLN